MSSRLVNVAGTFAPLMAVILVFAFGQSKFYEIYNPWMYERSVRNSEFPKRTGPAEKISSVPEIIPFKNKANKLVKRPCENHFPGDGDGKGKLSLDDEYCIKKKMADIAIRYNTYYDLKSDSKHFDQFSFDAYGQMYDALYTFLGNPNRNANDLVTIQGHSLKLRAILLLPSGANEKVGNKLVQKLNNFLLEYMSKRV